jgi:acyl-CoA synthetase (NDP forming)
MAETGIPAAVGGIEAAMSALSRICAWSRELNRPDRPQSVHGAGTEKPVGEFHVLDYLARHGVAVIPTKLARSAAEAVALASEIAGPCVLKISSVDIAHKTEVGGVALGVVGSDAVAAAYESIVGSVKARMPHAALEGVLVAPMRREGVELLVGTMRDPQWGAVLTLGLGGIWTEVLKDTQLTLLPSTPVEIESMLLKLRGARLLQGYRGLPPVDLGRLALMIARIGDAALALGPELETLEVNPLLAHGSQIEALDALTVWTE